MKTVDIRTAFTHWYVVCNDEHIKIDNYHDALHEFLSNGKQCNLMSEQQYKMRYEKQFLG